MDSSKNSLCDVAGPENCNNLMNARENCASKKNKVEQLPYKMVIDVSSTSSSSSTEQLYHCRAINCPRVFHTFSDRSEHVRATGHGVTSSTLSSKRATMKRLCVFNDSPQVYQSRGMHNQRQSINLFDPPKVNPFDPESHLQNLHHLQGQHREREHRDREVSINPQVYQQVGGMHKRKSDLFDPRMNPFDPDSHLQEPPNAHPSVGQNREREHRDRELREHLLREHLEELEELEERQLGELQLLERQLLERQLRKPQVQVHPLPVLRPPLRQLQERTQNAEPDGTPISKWNKKAFQCVECASSYSRASRLDHHVRVSHRGQKPYRCTHSPGDCSFSCGTRFAMVNHLRDHHGLNTAHAHNDGGRPIAWAKHYKYIPG